MSAISNNLENQLLNALLDQAAYPTHSTVWIALFGTGYNLESNSFGAEITGSGYASEITNTQTITFDVNSAWETIEAIAIVTGAGGVQGNGDILFWTTINSLNAQNNLDLVINPGELKVRLN